MKVITFSKKFPKGHPKAVQPTWFVEKIWKSIWDDYPSGHNPLYPYWQVYDQHFPLKMDHAENIHTHTPKHHTIRAGNRWKVGDMISLRVWSDKPYRSKQVEFAQVEVKKVWSIEIWVSDRMTIGFPDVPGSQIRMLPLCEVAANDGLDCSDFESWFRIHPKKKERTVFKGQIICWSDTVNY
jgi:hypothetical protein